VQEFCEWIDILGPALRLEHVLGNVVNLVPLPVVRVEKRLYMTPSALYCVGVGASALVYELNAVVDGAVCVTLCLESPIRTPAVTDDRSARFDPVTNNSPNALL
jgi:hypothetical protein